MQTDTIEPEIIKNYSSRESLLKTNAELISDFRKRVSARRFRVAEGDSVKLGYVRCLTNAISLQSAILKDIELDEVRHELQELRELVEKGNINGRSK